MLLFSGLASISRVQTEQETVFERDASGLVKKIESKWNGHINAASFVHMSHANQLTLLPMIFRNSMSILMLVWISRLFSSIQTLHTINMMRWKQR